MGLKVRFNDEPQPWEIQRSRVEEQTRKLGKRNHIKDLRNDLLVYRDHPDEQVLEDGLDNLIEAVKNYFYDLAVEAQHSGLMNLLYNDDNGYGKAPDLEEWLISEDYN